MPSELREGEKLFSVKQVQEMLPQIIETEFDSVDNIVVIGKEGEPAAVVISIASYRFLQRYAGEALAPR